MADEQGYERLRAVLRDVQGDEDALRVLEDAYDQAARGKGNERHADQRPWHQQPLAVIPDLVGDGFTLGQACKKLQEQLRLPTWERGRAECLGAIVYLAACVARWRRPSDEAWFGSTDLTDADHIEPIVSLIEDAAILRANGNPLRSEECLLDAIRKVAQYVARRDAEEDVAETTCGSSDQSRS